MGIPAATWICLNCHQTNIGDRCGTCRSSIGLRPNPAVKSKPYTVFMLRIPNEDHSRLTQAALRAGRSLHAFILTTAIDASFETGETGVAARRKVAEARELQIKRVFLQKAIDREERKLIATGKFVRAVDGEVYEIGASRGAVRLCEDLRKEVADAEKRASGMVQMTSGDSQGAWIDK